MNDTEKPKIERERITISLPKESAVRLRQLAFHHKQTTSGVVRDWIDDAWKRSGLERQEREAKG